MAPAGSEIEAIHHGTHRYGLWHWQALGYTPMGLEVWCAMRSLDLLAARADVDPERRPCRVVPTSADLVALTTTSSGGP